MDSTRRDNQDDGRSRSNSDGALFEWLVGVRIHQVPSLARLQRPGPRILSKRAAAICGSL